MPQSRNTSVELSKFDGQDVSWPLWKMESEREVHQNSRIDPSEKVCLLKALKYGSPPYELAAQYAGLKDAYTLTYKDLCERFDEEKTTIRDHIEELIDLPKRFRICNPRNSIQLERLCRVVKTKITISESDGSRRSELRVDRIDRHRKVSSTGAKG